MARVLIVDDREDNLYFLKTLFEGHGYVVEAAANGKEALDAARAQLPDIVITDLLMPIMDGYTLLRHWRNDTTLEHVPFVVYTATYTDAEDEKLAFDLGADAFVLKPAEPEVLVAAVQDARDRHAAVRASRSPPERERDGEADALEAYSRILVRKLEEKMLELDEANRALQRDIVERKQAQTLLEQRTALLRIAGRAARLGGWVLQLPERTLTWSDEVYALHEIAPRPPATLDAAVDFLAPQNRAEAVAHIEACADAGKPFDVELASLTAAGETKWLRLIGEAVRDDSGRIVRVQGALQDVSERRQLEQKLQQAQTMESIAALTGGMAHDLNNVLTPMLLAVSSLRDDVDDPRAQRDLATIEACAERGAAMVQQVLSFARGGESSQVELDVANVVNDLARIARDTLPRGIELVTHTAPELWPIVGDATQLNQVLLNLLVNARDAMQDGGTLNVAADNVVVDEPPAAVAGTAATGAYVRLSVADTGSGIAPGIRARIFDPLFTTKVRGQGTGLGLSTVDAIVRRHNGFVTIDSAVGAGAAFRVHLPAATGPTPAADAPADRGAWQGDGELILVVGGEAAVRTLNRHALEAFGYRVVTAATTVEARACLAQNEDITLMLTDGHELPPDIRENYPRLRVITIGAAGGDADAAGARLTRPYTIDAMLASVGNALKPA